MNKKQYDVSEVAISHDAQNWDWPMQRHDDVIKVVATDKTFEIGVDVQYYTPSEIRVTVQGRAVEICCQHELRTDEFGDVFREFYRCFKLPSDVDVSSLKGHLSRRGILTLSASKRKRLFVI